MPGGGIVVAVAVGTGVSVGAKVGDAVGVCVGVDPSTCSTVLFALFVWSRSEVVVLAEAVFRLSGNVAGATA